MNAAALIRAAQASGIELSLVNGKVKVTGPRVAVERLLASLREHRVALAKALQSGSTEPPYRMPTDITSVSTGWFALAAAYQSHCLQCSICIATGGDVQYRPRCGVGAALWRSCPD